MISNLFNSDKRTPQARLIENVQTKCIIFREALRIRVKKFKQSLPENYAKSTKIANTARNFKKIFRGSMPPDPPEPFLFLNQLQISSAEKNTLEKDAEIMAPPFKISCCATVSQLTSKSRSLVKISKRRLPPLLVCEIID